MKRPVRKHAPRGQLNSTNKKFLTRKTAGQVSERGAREEERDVSGFKDRIAQEKHQEFLALEVA